MMEIKLRYQRISINVFVTCCTLLYQFYLNNRRFRIIPYRIITLSFRVLFSFSVIIKNTFCLTICLIFFRKLKLQLFEGMKAYRGVDGRIRIFRPNMNMNRMNLSAKRSGLPTFDGDEFIKCMQRLVSIDQEWVPHTEKASLYIRPTLIGIDPTLGVASSDSALLYTILSPVGGYFDKNNTSGGVSLLADPQYTRAWPGGVGDRKMGSNYAPTIHVQKEASSKGLQQVLWLYGPEHQLTEVGTMNIFVLFVNEQGGKLHSLQNLTVLY